MITRTILLPSRSFLTRASQRMCHLGLLILWIHLHITPSLTYNGGCHGDNDAFKCEFRCGGDGVEVFLTVLGYAMANETSVVGGVEERGSEALAL